MRHLATNHTFQIVLQATLRRYRVELLLNILGKFIVLQLGQGLERIIPCTIMDKHSAPPLFAGDNLKRYFDWK